VAPDISRVRKPAPPAPVLDDETRRRLEAQLPRTGPTLLEGSRPPSRPGWVVAWAFAWVVVAVVVPPLGPHVWYGLFATLCLTALLARRRRLRTTSRRSVRERLGGECWLLVGGLLLCLFGSGGLLSVQVPSARPVLILLAVPVGILTLVAFTVGLERRVFRPRRLVRRRR